MKLTKEEKKILRGYVLHQISEGADLIPETDPSWEFFKGLISDLNGFVALLKILEPLEVKTVMSEIDEIVEKLNEDKDKGSKEVLLTLASHDEYCEVFKNL